MVIVVLVVVVVLVADGVAFAVVAVQVVAHLNVSPAILVYAAMRGVGGRMAASQRKT